MKSCKAIEKSEERAPFTQCHVVCECEHYIQPHIDPNILTTFWSIAQKSSWECNRRISFPTLELIVQLTKSSAFCAFHNKSISHSKSSILRIRDYKWKLNITPATMLSNSSKYLNVSFAMPPSKTPFKTLCTTYIQSVEWLYSDLCKTQHLVVIVHQSLWCETSKEILLSYHHWSHKQKIIED